jgi:hypothetical protein
METMSKRELARRHLYKLTALGAAAVASKVMAPKSAKANHPSR